MNWALIFLSHVLVRVTIAVMNTMITSTLGRKVIFGLHLRKPGQEPEAEAAADRGHGGVLFIALFLLAS